jgi:class 3 adenylate cyclase
MPEGPEYQGSFVERKLATILSADVAGFSRLMGEDEEGTLHTFRHHKKVFESLVAMHRGRIFNTAGDAILAEFNSAVEAVRCATDIQSALRTRNDQLPPGRQVCFRIGVNLGDVMVQGQDLLGDGVNVASRLQTAAEPGGICISGSVHDQILNKLSLAFQSLGEKSYKNIPQPVRTFSIISAESGIIPPPPQPRSARTNPALWLAAGFLLVVGGGYAAYAFFHRSHQNPPEVVATAPAETPAPQPNENPAPPPKHKTVAPAPSPTPPPKPSGQVRIFDGRYSGPVCYGQTMSHHTHCYTAEGTVRGSTINGRWAVDNERGVVMTLEGEVSRAGDVRLYMHSENSDGTRVNTINLSGKIREGLLECSGKFLNGRSATLNWHLSPDAGH